jgi:hypothetical protein
MPLKRGSPSRVPPVAGRAVFVDDPEPRERLREGGAAPCDHVLRCPAFQCGDLICQVAVRDPRIGPLCTLERPWGCRSSVRRRHHPTWARTRPSPWPQPVWQGPQWNSRYLAEVVRAENLQEAETPNRHVGPLAPPVSHEVHVIRDRARLDHLDHVERRLSVERHDLGRGWRNDRRPRRR